MRRHIDELLRVIIGLKDPSLLEKFLKDLLTPDEFAEIITRWQLVKLLHNGIPQRAIAKRLGVSITKITRGSHMLHNPRGGFNRVLQRPKK